MGNRTKKLIVALLTFTLLFNFLQGAFIIDINAKSSEEVSLTLNVKFEEGDPIDVNVRIESDEKDYIPEIVTVSKEKGKVTHKLKKRINGKKMSYTATIELPENYSVKGKTTRAVNMGTKSGKTGMTFTVKGSSVQQPKIDYDQKINFKFYREYEAGVTPVNARIEVFADNQREEHDHAFWNNISKLTILGYPKYKDKKEISYRIKISVPDSYYIVNGSGKVNELDLPLDTSKETAEVKFTIGQERKYMVTTEWKDISPEETNNLTVNARVYQEIDGVQKPYGAEFELNKKNDFQFEFEADTYTINDYGTIDKKINYSVEVDEIMDGEEYVSGRFDTRYDKLKIINTDAKVKVPVTIDWKGKIKKDSISFRAYSKDGEQITHGLSYEPSYTEQSFWLPKYIDGKRQESYIIKQHANIEGYDIEKEVEVNIWQPNPKAVFHNVYRRLANTEVKAIRIWNGGPLNGQAAKLRLVRYLNDQELQDVAEEPVITKLENNRLLYTWSNLLSETYEQQPYRYEVLEQEKHPHYELVIYKENDTYIVQNTYAHMRLIKKPVNYSFEKAGDSIEYQFTLTNDGLVPLKNLELTDEKLANAERPNGRLNLQKTELQPGESVTVYEKYYITEQDIMDGVVYNKATAVAQTEKGMKLQAEDAAGVYTDNVFVKIGKYKKLDGVETERLLGGVTFRLSGEAISNSITAMETENNGLEADKKDWTERLEQIRNVTGAAIVAEFAELQTKISAAEFTIGENNKKISGMKKAMEGNYVTDAKGVITLPMKDLPNGKYKLTETALDHELTKEVKGVEEVLRTEEKEGQIYTVYRWRIDPGYHLPQASEAITEFEILNGKIIGNRKILNYKTEQWGERTEITKKPETPKPQDPKPQDPKPQDPNQEKPKPEVLKPYQPEETLTISDTNLPEGKPKEEIKQEEQSSQDPENQGKAEEKPKEVLLEARQEEVNDEIPDDKVPEGVAGHLKMRETKELPQTTGIPASLLFLFGMSILATGIFVKKR